MLIATVDGASLTAHACDAVAGMDGVEAAFGVTRHAGGVGTASAPGSRIAVATVTSGVYSFLDARAGGALVSPRVVEDTGAGASVTLLAPASAPSDGADPTASTAATGESPVGTVQVSDVVPTDVLGDEYSYVVLVPQPSSGEVDRCYVRAAPADVDTVRAALPTVLAVGDKPVVVSDRLIGGRFSRDFSQEYATRTTQILPYLGGAVAALAWLIVSWFRRGEDGLYRTLGASVTDRVAMRGTEWLAVLVLGALTAWSGLLLMLAVTDAVTETALVAAAQSMAIAAATGFLVSAVWCAVPRRDTLSDLKDR